MDCVLIGFCFVFSTCMLVSCPRGLLEALFETKWYYANNNSFGIACTNSVLNWLGYLGLTPMFFTIPYVYHTCIIIIL